MWRDICGYEGYYQVSDDGRVRTLERYINRGDIIQLRRERAARCYVNQDGYLKVRLNKNGNTKEYFVHRLVAQAFIPNDECKPEVNHINANRTDNRKENLEWVSRQENIQHTINMGHHVSQICDFSGSNNPNYGNHVLKQYYADNPEMAKRLVRIGKANGRAKKVDLIIDGCTYSFDTIKDSAVFLREILNGKYSHSTLSSHISKAAITGEYIEGYIQAKYR